MRHALIMSAVFLAAACQHQQEKQFRGLYSNSIAVGNEEGRLRIHIRCRADSARAATLSLLLMDFGGRQFWQRDLGVTVRSGDNTIDSGYETGALLSGRDRNRLLLLLRLRDGDHVIGEEIHYFVPPGDLALSDPGLETKVEKHRQGYRIRLSARNLARNVWLEFPGRPGTFSRSHFDLLPGEQRSVWFYPGQQAGGLEDELRVHTDWDETQGNHF